MNQRNPFHGPKISNQNNLSHLHPLLSWQFALTLVIGLLLAFIPFNVCFGEIKVPDKKIIFIYSNSPDFPVYPILTTGFTEQIKNLGHFQPKYFFEYLEWNRWHTDPKYLDIVTDFWHQKYRQKQIDLIVLFGDPAGHFMRTRANKIFPGVPVIFAGNALLGYKESDFPSTFVALFATVDLKKSVELILRTQPGTRKVYLVLGDSEVERLRATDAEAQLKVFAGRVDFIFLNKLPFSKLLERIRTIEGDSVILYMNFLQDVEGNMYVPAQILKSIHREAPVPIYGTSDTFIGSGSIGGYMTSNTLVGRRAATLGTEIFLTGKLPTSRVETSSASEYIFNWQELKRWGVDLQRLPVGSRIELKDPDVWDIYRWHILGAIGLFSLQVLLIAGLLISRNVRKKAEEALRESEEKYRNLFDNANEAIFVVQDRKLVFLNPMTTMITGYSGEELRTKPFAEFIHPDDRDMVVDRHVRRIKGEKLPHVYSFRIIHRDGNIIWGELNAVLVNWKGKAATLNFLSNITDRKRAEEAIVVAKNDWENTFDIVTDMITVHDKDFNIVRANPAAKAILGLQLLEEMSLAKCFRLYHGTEKPPSGCVSCQSLQTGRPSTVEVFESHLNKYLEIRAMPRFGSDGRLVGLIHVVRDITERKRTEEEKRSLTERLQRAEKMEALGLLAGGVAHDLNNVLGIVVGYAEMLLMGTDKSSPIRSKLDNIMEGGQKAAAIVQDLLTLARRGVTGRDVLSLNSIISDCHKSPEFVQLSSFHPSVQIKVELEPDLPNISGSSVHLGKTIFNLVSNASEAMPKGGVLTIKTANQYLDKPIHGYDEIWEGDYVVLSVSDTGEGINADDIKRIFEPFYTKKVMGRSGTGLGLAVVWGTVKDHNGYINVQSEEGKGSTFTLYFPITREELSAEHVAVSISEYIGKGESILIVDDVKGQRSLAAEMLRKLNYNVTSASNGEEAVAYLKEHKTDLMVLDMIMDPGMDGLDTYRSVLKIRPKQKAIIVSGFSESDRVKAAQALGAGAYVRKPYVIEKLGLAVKKELDRST